MSAALLAFAAFWAGLLLGAGAGRIRLRRARPPSAAPSMATDLARPGPRGVLCDAALPPADAAGDLVQRLRARGVI